jgi:ribosomal-protein-serine acetyltransferase
MDKYALHLAEIITTPRLELRPAQPEHAKKLHAALLDGYADLVKWLGRPPQVPTLADVEEEIRQSIVSWNNREFLRFVAVSKTDGAIVGRMGFPPMQSDWRVPYFGISYFVAKSFGGEGYCTEAVNALTRYAFGVFKARRVEIKVDVDNPASRRIPQKLGFQLEATQRGIWPRTDKDELAIIETYCVFDTSTLPALEVSWR